MATPVRLKRWKAGKEVGKRNINKTRSKDVSMLVRLKRWKAGSDANGGKYCQEKHGVGASKVRLQRWKEVSTALVRNTVATVQGMDQ